MKSLNSSQEFLNKGMKFSTAVDLIAILYGCSFLKIRQSNFKITKVPKKQLKSI
jgi:hypothetical protein